MSDVAKLLPTLVVAVLSLLHRKIVFIFIYICSPLFTLAVQGMS